MANRYPEGSVTTIPAGYAQGMRWRRSHAYVNGFWLGQHELDVQAAIARLLGPGDGFVDLGANAGFFLLVAARRVGPAGWCVGVDPDPFNCDSIRAQIELNGLAGSCQALQVAAAEAPGTLRFAAGAPGDSTGHLADAAETGAAVIDVPATTLDEICATRPGRLALVKVDVEGAEARVLAGAKRVLADRRPAWLMDVHSPALGESCRATLTQAGYRFTDLAGTPLPDAAAGLPYHSIALPL
jgi:FkbM family methyltransferase